MNRILRNLIPFATLLISSGSLAAESTPHKSNLKSVTLITHDSPPYMGESLPEGGAIFYALKEIFKSANYDLKVVFAPSWTRAKVKALKDPLIDGYAPYRSIENEEIFEFSELFMQSPWVIIERKDKPIKWQKPEDLTKYIIGNVQGVELRPGIKELADAGKLQIENASNQTRNLLKLATNRVDLVFSDAYVFRYLLATDPLLEPYRDKLQINEKPIVIERYGLALKRKKEYADLMKKMNASNKEFVNLAEEYTKKLTPPPKK